MRAYEKLEIEKRIEKLEKMRDELKKKMAKHTRKEK
jgi:hypothetical protein